MYILLPAYNEERNLPALLKRIDCLAEEFPGLEVHIVDDGSQDGTYVAASLYRGRMPVHIHRHEVNQGLGAAMVTGFAKILERAADHELVITMDADNTHDPALVREMVKAVENGADVVIASRYQNGADQVGLSWGRKVLSKGASLFLGGLFQLDGVRDYSSGYRAYKAGVLRQAVNHYQGQLVQSRGFDCMAEILLKLRPFQPRFAEVPLVLRYDYKQGASKMPVMATVFHYFLMARRAQKLAGGNK